MNKWTNVALTIVFWIAFVVLTFLNHSMDRVISFCMFVFTFFIFSILSRFFLSKRDSTSRNVIAGVVTLGLALFLCVFLYWVDPTLGAHGIIRQSTFFQYAITWAVLIFFYRYFKDFIASRTG